MPVGRDYIKDFQNIGNVLFLKLEDSYGSRGPTLTPGTRETLPDTTPAIYSMHTQDKGQRTS